MISLQAVQALSFQGQVYDRRDKRRLSLRTLLRLLRRVEDRSRSFSGCTSVEWTIFYSVDLFQSQHSSSVKLNSITSAQRSLRQPRHHVLLTSALHLRLPSIQEQIHMPSKELRVLIQKPMARVRINMKVRMREELRDLNAVLRRDQEVIIAVRDEHRHSELADALVRVIRVRRTELRPSLRLARSDFRAEVWSAVLRSGENALPRGLGGGAAVRAGVEEGERGGGFEVLLCDGVGEGEEDVARADGGVRGAAGAGAGQDQLADQAGGGEGNVLRGAAAHGEAKEVDLRNVQGF